MEERVGLGDVVWIHLPMQCVCPQELEAVEGVWGERELIFLELKYGYE